MTHPTDIPHTLTLTISDWDKGVGEGRYQNLRVAVPMTVPGDSVTCSVIHVGQKRVQAKLIAMHAPSSLRTREPCPALLDGCGACSLGLWHYDAQKAMKVERIEKAFRQEGLTLTLDRLWADEAEESSSTRTRFRNKAIYYVDPVTGAVGHYARQSQDVVPSSLQCPQVPRWMAQWVERLILRAQPDTLAHWGVQSITLKDGDLDNPWASSRNRLALIVAKGAENTPESVWDERLASLLGESGVDSLYLHTKAHEDTSHRTWGTRHLAWGQEKLVTHYEGLPFLFDEMTFLQVNPRQTHRLYHLALSMADLQSTDHALDLYAGVGTLGLLMAPHVSRVTGIEIVPESVVCATRAARDLGFTHATYYAGAVENVLPNLALTPNVAMVDPAYKGMDRRAIDTIVRTPSLKRLVYVACSPESLARDAKYFIERGFTLTRLEAVDLFPGTDHVETVALLTR